MRRSTASSRGTRLGVAALVAFATPRLAGAACSAGPDFGQLLANCGGGYCYVVSPGLHTTQSLAGSFWSFGTGNAAVGPGNDNGAWPVGAWLVPYGTNLYFGGAWHSSLAIDGCITGNVAPGKPAEIMVVLLSDEGGPGDGFFAVASARRVVSAFPEFDFTFVAGGGLAHDIDLVQIPRARILGITRPDTYHFDGPELSQVSPGIYGDGSLAPEEIAKGYRIYMRSRSPTSPKTSAGWSAISEIVPLGQDAFISVPCPAATGELYLGYTLVFDSDFETAHVGRYTRVVCDQCASSDQDGDGFYSIVGDPECCPDPQVCDCNDANPNVHPFALEVCNGIDDDCNDVIDDVALPASVASLELDKQPGTTLLEWPPLAVATRYDVVRGDMMTLRDSGGSFTAATRSCVANDITVNRSDDPEDPDPGYGFWYLLRAANCTGVGSYDAPDAAQAAPRDAGIAASGHACP